MGEGEQSGRAELLNEVKRVLSHSLGSNILPARGDGPSWKVDWPWMLVLALAVALSFGFYFDTHESLCWFNLWMFGFLLLAMPIAYWVKKSIVRILEDEAFRGMTDEMATAATKLLRSNYGPRALWTATAWISASWAIAAVTTLVYQLWMDENLAWTPVFLWLVCSFVLIPAAKVGVDCTFYLAISKASQPEDLDDFPLTPAESPLVRGLARVGNRLVGFMTFSALYFSLLLFWRGPLQWFVLVSLTIFLIGSLGLGIAVYARVTTRLADLVATRRRRTLRELQARLERTAKCDRDGFASAFDLFELVSARNPKIGVSAAARGLLPILIQIATLIIAIQRALSP